MSKKQLGLTGRIILILIATIVLVSSIITIMSYNIFSNAMEIRFKRNLELTAKHLAVGASIALLLGDTKLITKLSKTILKDPSIVGVIVKNSKGKVVVKIGSKSDQSIDIPIKIASSEEPVIFLQNYQKNILGVLQIFYTKKHLNDLFKRLLFRVVVIAIATILIISLVSYYMIAKAILNPINELISVVKEVGKGNLNIKIPEADLPEINELSKAFNEMVKDLEHHRQALKDTYDRMAKQESLANIGKFAFTIAHEIKNPLGIIKGSIELIRKHNLDEETLQELISYIESETHRIDLLIKDFLELARFKDPRKVEIDVGTLFEDISAKIKLKHPDVKLDFKSNVDIIKTDPDKLERILTNIIRNSIEAGADKIEIELNKRDSCIEITIDDNGCGIDESIKDKIFDPFFTTKDTGTGLGLSIVMQEILSLNGNISVSDSPHGGARFHIILPMEEENGTHSRS